MVIGEKVIIRPVEEKDLASILKWSYIYDLKELFGFTSDFTNYNDVAASIGTDEKFPKDIYFTIVDKDDKSPIGGCMINDIDYANKRCLSSLYIGENNSRGKGFGIEAIRLLMQYAFFELNMNRIGFYVSDYNKRALKSSKECGFKVEGMMREGVYRNGRYHDVYYMGIIKSDYIKDVKGGDAECSEENM